MKYNATFRNIIGDIATFLLSLVISIITIAVVVIVEQHQSDYGRKFPIEQDDIRRRTIIALVGSAIQAVILVSI